MGQSSFLAALPPFGSVVLPGVLLLGIVIFVHELGHFLAAKWRGVTVLKFSLGMGPELVGFTSGGTRYCLAWIPLGGFVQMAGDQLAEDGSMPEGGPEKFLTHPWWGRLIIAVAGPAANLVTAFPIMLLACLVGLRQQDFPNELGALAANTRAYAAGLRQGDRIVGFAGRDVKTWHDLESAADAFGFKTPATFVLLRPLPDGSSRTSVVVPAADVKAVLHDLDPLKAPAVVGGVALGMPAYRAGLKEGDRVLLVDGAPIHSFDEIAPALRGKADRPVHFRLERDGKPFDIDIAPMRMDGKGETALIGIEPPRTLVYVEPMPLRRAFPTALVATAQLVPSVYASLWLTLSNLLYYRESVGGPIFIAQMASDAAKHGLGHWLYLLALINVAIMAFNLMPIPLLDGGHITLALLEGVRRRSVSGRTYLNFQKVGLVLVGTLFVFILSNDLLRPFKRLRAIDKAPRETTTVEPSPR